MVEFILLSSFKNKIYRNMFFLVGDQILPQLLRLFSYLQLYGAQEAHTR